MKIKNLGLIKNSEIELENFIVFTGGNNTGKTYMSYMLYGILSYLKDLEFDFISEDEVKKAILDSDEDGSLTKKTTFKIDLENIKKTVVKKAINGLHKDLKDIALKNFKLKASEFEKLELDISKETIYKFYNLNNFSKRSKQNIEFSNFITVTMIYEESSVEITLIKKDIDNKLNNKSDMEKIIRIIPFIINQQIVNTPENIFYIPAERTGINVFRNELNEGRLKTYDTIMNTIQYASLKDKKEKDNLERKLFQDNLSMFLGIEKSAYPKPISDYITFLNEMKTGNEERDNRNDSDTFEPGRYIRDNILNGKYEIDDDDNSVSFRHRYGKTMYRTKAIPFHVVSSSIKSLFGLDYFLDNIGKVGDFIIIDEPELSLHYENQRKLAELFYNLSKLGYKIILSTHSDIFIRELTNIILEEKIKKTDKNIEKSIKIYNFKDSTMTDLGPISKINEFNNFDDVSADIDNKYFELLSQLDSLED